MFRQRRMILIALVMLMICALPGLASASLLDTIQQRGKLIVGIQTSAPPASMVNERGEIVGFEVDQQDDRPQAGVAVEFKQLTDATRIPMISRVPLIS